MQAADCYVAIKKQFNLKSIPLNDFDAEWIQKTARLPSPLFRNYFQSSPSGAARRFCWATPSL
jgi:hypothetical protein